jgi:hypothetical protein
MPIKGFLFARHLERRPDNNYDVLNISLSTPFLDGPPQEFPARVTRECLVHLRRDGNVGNSSVRLRFQLADATGQPTAHPCPAVHEAQFEDGQWTCHVPVKLDFEFPAPGLYHLDIIPEGGNPEEVYRCPIDLTIDNRAIPRLVYAMDWTVTTDSPMP